MSKKKMIEVYIAVIISVIISCVVVGVSRLSVNRSERLEKMEGYECGFQPFSVELGEFDVQFYIVALLFLIFDVELMLLFPWSIIASSMGIMTYGIFLVFVTVLIVGMSYEWTVGGLEV